MERIVELQHFGNDRYLIAIGGRGEGCLDAQVRMAVKVRRSYGTVYEPVSMNAQLYGTLKLAGFNVCQH